MANFEIVAIPNQYKNTLDDFMDSPNPEFPDRVGPIDESSRNALMFENSSADLLKQDCFKENFLDRSSRLARKNKNSQVCQCRVVATPVGYAKS